MIPVTSVLLPFSFKMPLAEEWKSILKGKFPSYKIEVDAFLDSIEIATSTKVAASKIYEAICDAPEVNATLKSIYEEALFGKNKDVKARIKNRIGNFRRNLK